jgi:hypothetical protein
MFTLSSKRQAREIEELKSQIAALTQPGHVAPRQTWGLGLEQGKNQVEIERFQLEKEKFAAENARFEAQSSRTYAGQVVQALLLLNGAAALAILILIGSFAKHAHLKGLLSSLPDPLALFGQGAALAVLTAVLAYLGEAPSPNGNKLWGTSLQVFAMAFAAGSLLFFLGGISQAASVFTAFGLQAGPAMALR